jgi:rhodanese-related sulfurtransferase
MNLQQILIFIVGTLLLTGLMNCSSEKNHTTISNTELVALLQQGVPLFDIRLAEEWQTTGVIAGSHPLTFFLADGSLNQDFMKSFVVLAQKDKPLILISDNGLQSSRVAQFLTAKEGYRQIYSAKGGMQSWLAESRPVIPVTPAPTADEPLGGNTAR